MKNAALGLIVTAIVLLAVSPCVASNGEALFAAQTNPPAVKWPDVLKRDADWFGTGEALRIADNLLLYQRDSGGWPKNIDMASVLTPAAKASLVKQKDATDSTIENGATHTQLRY